MALLDKSRFSRLKKNARSKSPKRVKGLPLVKLLPNMVTIIGMCFGLFALKFAMSNQWEIAVAFIIISAFIDGMDGRLARLLNATSNFGLQLDSLADFFNFGVAPALILYLWKTHEIKGIGWAVALFFVISQALRLARYNSSVDEKDDEELSIIKERFFIGIPAPLGGALSTAPMMLEFFMHKHFPEQNFSVPVEVLVAYLLVIAYLMVSRVPTVSIKKIRIKRSYSMAALSAIAMLFIAMILEPWFILPLVGLVYLCTIPVSSWMYYRIKRH
jgi:CDP-diacylglycerol--serine O-phosphatidyltransferase